MRVLLDTQAFLWFVSGDARLSADARQLIEDTSNERIISVVSLWEIAIKFSIGKLNLALPFAIFIPQQLHKNLIDQLDITFDHLATVTILPFHHKDPFDRLMIAQAIVEQVPVISIDSTFDLYGITRLW
ncbi:MAG: type II toxin-antitoxin system VapC family toxin [Chloroflexia bacterium]